MIDLGVILAGGKGRRLGGVDKASLMLGDRALYEIVIGKLASTCRSLIVVAPEKPDWVDELAIGFVPDVLRPDGLTLGPAGGLLGALRHLRAVQPAGRLVTVPVDAPFFPADLIGMLDLAVTGASGAVAEAGGRLHPVFGAWPASILPAIETMILRENEYALHKIATRLGAVRVQLEAVEHAFLNVNTPEDLAQARALFERGM